MGKILDVCLFIQTAISTLDQQPVFDAALWSVLEWLSRYYIAPLGEVVDAAMPQALRKGRPLMPAATRVWRLTEHGRSSAIEELGRAPLQLAIVKRFMQTAVLSSRDFKQESAGWRHEGSWRDFACNPLTADAE